MPIHVTRASILKRSSSRSGLRSRDQRHYSFHEASAAWLWLRDVSTRRRGRLLIFDPTPDLVPFGQLLLVQQDSLCAAVTDTVG